MDLDHPLAPDTPTDGAERVVALGASAGGLLALEQFLAHVPAGSGLSFVVVQHLDPKHKPMLVEILQRSTAMQVVEATEGMDLRPDVVHVIPANKDLTVSCGKLHLAVPSQPRGTHLPIDLLFSSLARDRGDQAIGVVLSGMGSDGTVGLQSIKSQGGLTLAQEPATAQFQSMPSSAIAADCVDIVMPPAGLPEAILRSVAARRHEQAMPSASDDSDSVELASILVMLRHRSKHDLSEYKVNTLRRRIQRRMGVHGLSLLREYEGFVRQNPHELDLLFKEMLIGVTSFFRDPAIWQELKDKVLPVLLSRCAADSQLRAWVLGCSTGEEAYSLAMVLREAMDARADPSPSVLIFASDLSADAISVARRGRYPSTISADVGADRLQRFFDRDGGDFVVRRSIRNMLLFAQHDVILDPPFTRLDLLSCRNLLIYFDAQLQRRVLPLFAYSLRPGGTLLLGSSESVGSAQAQFIVASEKSRLYWRNGNPVTAGSMQFPVHHPQSSVNFPQEPTVPLPTAANMSNLQSLAEQALLRELSPPAVLVNDQGDVVFINGSIGKYLEPAAGKANWNIHVMVRSAIRAQVTSALRQSILDKKSIQLRGLTLDPDSRDTIDVTVKPLMEPLGVAGLTMVAFYEVAQGLPAKRKRRSAAGGMADEMAAELQRWKEEAIALRHEMSTAAERLQAANEELQSTNEELQSANEELTTSKEESQSMNEELQTLNSELQSKLDDLGMAQSDMQNLLNSTEIATLFLDNALNVRRYTDQITRTIHLRSADIGRPLSDLASTLNYPSMVADARETLRTLAFKETEASTTDGLWYRVRIHPYRTLANVIEGVVITLIDITSAKELEARLRLSGSAH